MKKGLCAAGVIVLVFLVTGMCWASPGMNAAKFGGHDWGNESDGSEGGDTPWTFLFYLAADNEQEAYADATIAQLLAGTKGVSNHPQVLVLIDRLDEPGTEIFEIVGGAKVPLATYDEQNTADGAVLQTFAEYALGEADHDSVAFVMKSEGFSWRGIGRDHTHDVGSDEDQRSDGKGQWGLHGGLFLLEFLFVGSSQEATKLQTRTANPLA